MNNSINYLKIKKLVISLQVLGILILGSFIGLGFALYHEPALEEEKAIAWCGTIALSKAQGPKVLLNDAAVKGKELFENNCSPCHNIQREMVGPPLLGIDKRRDMKWIVKWVQNPSKVIASKDPYALKIVADYKNAGIMTGFPALKKEDIESIIAYIAAH